MGRYIQDYFYNGQIDGVMQSVDSYMQTAGFQPVLFDGENVYKKGNGFLTAPRFFKISYVQGVIRVEAWMKYALLPGVYVGEMDLSGFAGSAVRKPLKDAVAYAESVCLSVGAVKAAPGHQAVFGGANPAMQQPTQPYVAQPTGAVPPAQPYNTQPYAQPMGAPTMQEPPANLKAYIETCAPDSIRNGIRNAAITCYVCAGITAVVSLLMNPYGLIDAVLLLALALGTHLGKSRVCAILLLVFSIIECVVGTILSGTFSGWIWIVASAYAVYAFEQARKGYQQYFSGNGNPPQNPPTQNF